jgi:hypothetical protein
LKRIDSLIGVAVYCAMRKSKQVKYVIAAYEKGYRILDDGSIVSPKGKVIQGHIGERWYREFSFRIGGKTAHVRVHQLMAFQKYGELALSEGVQVRHSNGVATDNSRDNILIGSSSENHLDRDPEKRKAHAVHAASFCRSLSSSDAQQLIDDRAAGVSYKTLMKKYGIARETASCIVNGKTYPELKRPQK